MNSTDWHIFEILLVLRLAQVDLEKRRTIVDFIFVEAPKHYVGKLRR